MKFVQRIYILCLFVLLTFGNFASYEREQNLQESNKKVIDLLFDNYQDLLGCYKPHYPDYSCRKCKVESCGTDIYAKPYWQCTVHNCC